MFAVSSCRGIIHGDIKLENIMLAGTHTLDEVKLIGMLTNYSFLAYKYFHSTIIHNALSNKMNTSCCAVLQTLAWLSV